jgi:hypothetical protein
VRPDLGIWRTYICVSVYEPPCRAERISYRRAQACPVVIFYRKYLAVILLG